MPACYSPRGRYGDSICRRILFFRGGSFRFDDLFRYLFALCLFLYSPGARYCSVLYSVRFFGRLVRAAGLFFCRIFVVFCCDPFSGRFFRCYFFRCGYFRCGFL